MARVEAPSLRTRTAATTNPGDVFLRPLQMSDRDRVRRWMAEPAVIRFTVQVPGPEFGPVVPYSDAEADRYLELLVRDPDRRSWAIELDGVHVGNVGLKGHDWPRRTAECFIEIGELRVRGRGVGEAAMTQLLDRAFGDVGLVCVRLGVFEFNEPAINLYRKLGFVDDGRHGSHYVDGRTWTVNAMMLDAARWRARELR